MISPIPRTGGVVVVRFGNSIHVQDLIKNYEDAHGPLHKVLGGGMSEEEAMRGIIEAWESTESEQQLYQAITLRIERGLLDLEEETAREWPGPPTGLCRILTNRCEGRMQVRVTTDGD